jgi:hypothetical protein
MTEARDRTMRRLRRVAAWIASGATIGLAAAMSISCLIAEPQTDLPGVPAFRPLVLRGAAVPTPNAVLGVYPEQLVVPIELVDPSVTFKWRVYVDYNPITGAGLEVDGTSAPSGIPARIRTLEIQTVRRTDLDRCHVIEFIVAKSFLGESEGKNTHTPAEPGEADSITWFYSPTGDLAGCPVLDAGLIPRLDGGADGADGARDGGGG